MLYKIGIVAAVLGVVGFLLGSTAFAEPRISISPVEGPAATDTVVQVHGEGFTPSLEVQIEAKPAHPINGETIIFTTAVTRADGSFDAEITIPSLSTVRSQVGWPEGQEIYVFVLELTGGFITEGQIQDAPRALFTFSTETESDTDLPATGRRLVSDGAGPSRPLVLALAAGLALLAGGSFFAGRRLKRKRLL